MNKFKYVLIITIVSSFFSLIVSLCACSINGCSTNNNSTLCNVIFTASEGGTIGGIAEQKIMYGDDAETVFAVPSTGYKFIKWSDGITTPERQDKNITSDKSVTAIFEKITITVTYIASEGGTIDGIAVQEIGYGDDAETVAAVPSTGYKFVKWSDGITAPERQDRDITVDKSVTAEFEKIRITVTYTASEGGTIDGITEQEIEYGEDAVAVVAVPQTGYKFIRWSDGNGSTIRREFNVTSEICLNAEFEFLYESGDGSTLNPFMITTYSQLNNMWYYPNSNYKLLNDLDLTDINHEPIFDDTTPFAGTFNGNNHTIKNLTVNTEINFPSLFGFIGNGTISYLDLANVDIKTVNFDTISAQHNYYVGAIAGVSFGIIHDITVSGEIAADELYYDGVAIGGIIGMANGTIANCTTDIQIEILDVQRKYEKNTNEPFCFGGVLGVGDCVDISNCSVIGSINVESAPNIVLAGGLVGFYYSENQNNIYSCTTNFVLNCNYQITAGGLIAKFCGYAGSKTQIENCETYGSICCYRSGGFAYQFDNYGELTIINCRSNSEVSAYTRAAGFVYSFDNVEIKNCCSTGEVEATFVNSTGGSGGFASGFCINATNIYFYQCYSTSTVTAINAFGLAQNANNCTIEQSYTRGEIYAGLRGASLSFYASSSNIINCYSLSVLEITNKDPNNRGRTLVGGFIYGLTDSVIENCYFAGVVNGTVYSAGDFGMGSLVGGFIGHLEDSYVVNCYTLFKENNFASAVICENKNSDISLSLEVFNNFQDMYLLADNLNKDDAIIWIENENGFPTLNYQKNFH